jgi:3-hydroxybutyryl-CoA dehydratase
MMNQHQRSAYFADLEEGQDWGVHDWTLTPEFARGWSEVTGDDFPIYHDGADTQAVYGKPIAPPSIAFIFLTECIQALMPNRAPGGVHARQTLRFLAPIHVGDTLSTSLTVVRKYLKRERRYVELRSMTRNQRGEEVLEAFRVTIWAA